MFRLTSSMRLVVSVILLCFLFQDGFAQTKGNLSHCRKVDLDDNVQVVQEGWPYMIKLELFLEQSSYSPLEWFDEGLGEDDVLKCIVLNDNGTVINTKNTTIYSMDNLGTLLPDLSPQGLHEYVLELRAPTIQRCLTMTLRLRVVAFQPEPCIDLPVHTRKAQLGRLYKLYCSDDRIIDPGRHGATGLEYQWVKNCSNRTIGRGNKFIIPLVAFEDEGIYTCFMTYKGMKKPMNSQRIISKCPTVQLLSKPSFTCSNEIVHRNVGEEAAITCVGRIGKQQPTLNHFTYTWQKELKDGELTDPYKCGSPYHENRNPHISCEFEIEKRSLKNCDGTSSIDLHFRISNITEDDFGAYVLELETSLSTASTARGHPRVNVTFLLQRDDVTELLNYPLALGITVSMIFVLLIFFILFHRVLYVRVCLKRHCGMYTEEDKKYGAYLAYTYSHEYDRFCLDYTKDSIRATRRALEGMGYTVLDERRDWSSGCYRAESSQLLIQKSHRVVIFLTSCFINDAWSMALLQKSFDEMIQRGKKLIFIIFPGILEYLEQYHSSDNGCLMIQRAIQLSYSIKWSNDDDFDKTRFNLQLEEAMPKLRSQKQNRAFGKLSSGSELSSSSYKGVVFQRCISNETDVTDIDLEGVEDMKQESIEEEEQMSLNVLS